MRRFWPASATSIDPSVRRGERVRMSLRAFGPGFCAGGREKEGGRWVYPSQLAFTFSHASKKERKKGLEKMRVMSYPITHAIHGHPDNCSRCIHIRIKRKKDAESGAITQPVVWGYWKENCWLIIQTQKPVKTVYSSIFSKWHNSLANYILASLTAQCSNNWPQKRTREMTLDVATAKPRAHATRNLRINITVTAATTVASAATVQHARKKKKTWRHKRFKLFWFVNEIKLNVIF